LLLGAVLIDQDAFAWPVLELMSLGERDGGS
jgi:hypothetical protein